MADFPRAHLNIPAERDIPSLTDVISTDRCRLFAGGNGGVPGRFLECAARLAASGVNLKAMLIEKKLEKRLEASPSRCYILKSDDIAAVR